MKKFNEMVPASSICSDAEDCEDLGHVDGFVRGYRAEVVHRDGSKSWTSCAYIECEPEEHFFDEHRERSLNYMGFEFTGRLSFMGYFVEDYCGDYKGVD